MSETYVAKKVIVEDLLADNAIEALVDDRIFFGVKPNDEDLPAIVFSVIGSPDSETVDANRIFTNPVFFIKAIAEDDETASKIAKEIDRVVSAIDRTEDWEGTTYYIHGVRRSSETQFSENTEGIRYFHNGANYRMNILTE